MRVRACSSSSPMTSTTVVPTRITSDGPTVTLRTTLPCQPKNEPNRSGIDWPVSLMSWATSSWTTIVAPNVVTNHEMLVTGSKRPSGATATKSTRTPTPAVRITTARVTRTSETSPCPRSV